MAQINYDPLKRTVKMWGTMEHLYDYYEAQGYFFSREILTRYFLSLKTKPFVILTGISGTGKTKIAQVFADYMCQDEKTPEERARRYVFVPVRPDWMDNRGLLGYFNLLAETYHATPVLRLLLEAEKYPDKPYFAILDEMNLAKVEQYFSDFLSIMESRTGGNLRGEPLDLHSVAKAETQDGLSIPRKLCIPPNVYFTGTVNVDESTYMFSPKVLDRANVIEFNDVNLANYEKGIVASDRFVLKDQDVRQTLLSVTDQTPFCSKTDFTEILKTAPAVRDHLARISGILHPYNLHFGYRVINEISRYIRIASEMVQDFDLEETMDIQILQKILPKFHGTQAKLEEPLGKLLGFCCGMEGVPEESYLEKAEAFDADARFPRSAQKLTRMIRNLRVQGYTSFIE
jgi:5-methylcytosine-specific restriction endonuclease McrBC GTP-binding regulatory subunit McrB